MLIKFAHEDFIADRRFNNTSKVNVQNYWYIPIYLLNIALFDKGVINVEDVTHLHLREYPRQCQEKGNNPI